MAIRISTTHIWTKLFIPIIWASRLLTIFLILSFLYLLLPTEGYWGIAYIIGFFGAIMLHASTLEQRYHVLQTYLYVVINLGTPISLIEAKKMILLFAPSDQGKWYPLTGIKDIPKEHRRKVLFDSAKKIYNEMGYEFENTDTDYNYTENFRTDYESAALPEGLSYLIGMLCKMAKSDGLITKEEIQLIDKFLVNILNIDSEIRIKVAKIFNHTKANNTPFEYYARQFFAIHSSNVDLLNAVYILLKDIALSDGILSTEERILLKQAFFLFELNETKYQEYKSSETKQNQYADNDLDKYHAKVLGLDGEITIEKIKLAYRKLATQYHPDKVSHLGDKIRDFAEGEMKKINEAYEYFQKKYQVK